jgi:hypothetical protein
MVAQENVFGKDFPFLRTILEIPQIDEPKAFEALVELSVLVRLLSAEQHDLVPRNPAAPAGQDHEATELFFVEEASDCIYTLLNSVRREFSQGHRSHVLQVVAVPIHREFPKYDFFLLHRTNEVWSVAAGYQCKQTSEYPTEAAEDNTRVAVSVWVEGRCKENRAATDGAGKRRLVDNITSKGWVLMSASAQDDFLGFTVAQALPSRTVDPANAHYRNLCLAEKAYKELTTKTMNP